MMPLQVGNTKLARLLKCGELCSIWLPTKCATTPYSYSYSLYIIAMTLYSSLLVIIDSILKNKFLLFSIFFLKLLGNR